MYSVELSFLMMCMAFRVFSALYHLLLARHFFIQDVSSSRIISRLEVKPSVENHLCARHWLAVSLRLGSGCRRLLIRSLAGCDVWFIWSMLRSYSALSDLTIVLSLVPEKNGDTPPDTSMYTITPRDQRSVAGLTSSQFRASGARYSRVPWSWVSLCEL